MGAYTSLWKNRLLAVCVKLLIFVMVAVAIWHVAIVAFPIESNIWLHVISAILLAYLAWQLKKVQ